MEFSGDDQLLLTLTGSPDWTLTCWNWNKAKAVASSQVSITSAMMRCFFSPLDPTVACVTGKDQVKFFRIADREVRRLHDYSFTDRSFTAQCWMRYPDDQ